MIICLLWRIDIINIGTHIVKHRAVRSVNVKTCVIAVCRVSITPSYMEATSLSGRTDKLTHVYKSSVCFFRFYVIPVINPKVLPDNIGVTQICSLCRKSLL